MHSYLYRVEVHVNVNLVHSKDIRIKCDNLYLVPISLIYCTFITYI